MTTKHTPGMTKQIKAGKRTPDFFIWMLSAFVSVAAVAVLAVAWGVQ